MSDTITYRGYTIAIGEDEFAEDPRKDCTPAGTMCCEHRHYTLGDGGVELLRESLRDYVELEGDEDDQQLVDLAEKAGYIILPLYLFDHSGLTISTSSSRFRAADPAGWDWGMLGIIFMSPKRMQEEGMDEETAIKCMNGEVEEYDQFLRGDVWFYQIEDDGGEIVDSLSGIYGYDYAEEQAKECVDSMLAGVICEQEELQLQP